MFSVARDISHIYDMKSEQDCCCPKGSHPITREETSGCHKGKHTGSMQNISSSVRAALIPSFPIKLVIFFKLCLLELIY